MNTQKLVKAFSPKEVAEVVSKYLKEGNLAGVLSMFHESCVICFPPEEPSKDGITGALSVFDDFILQKPLLKSTLTGQKINGDIALIQAEWTFEDQDGSIIAQGNSTEVVKQNSDGSWVYYIDCPLGLPPIK